ncbi:MAG: hypothetical protein KBD56_07935 [Candidatus Eisenbacteria bacterium]|nr:hypothetical protein [Candidatus Eisenbacteria bacterium]
MRRLPTSISAMRALFRIFLAALPLGALLLGSVSAQIIADIDNISERGLYERRFSLPQDVDATIDAVGSGSIEKDALFAYPWILDLRTRRVVWTFDTARAQKTKKQDNLSLHSQVHLPAGDYALYFSALGGAFPVEKSIKILKLFNLGKVSFSGKNMRWDEVGEPREWRVSVRAAEGSPPVSVGEVPADLDLGAILRFHRLTDESDRRALLEVSRPVQLRVLAIGEYVADAQGFADGAWILDCSTFERVWEMTLLNTAEAGGARKNRMFDGTIALAPGRYLATCVSDDSHSYENWNSQPPYDPESWGLTIFRDPANPSAVAVTIDPLEKNLIARIDRVGDSEFRTAEFVLKHEARLGIRAFGEWSESSDRQLDFGWIEDARTLEQVWTMESNRGAYASGDSRNRIVEESLRLPPGFYRVAYVSDNAHSFAGWHNRGPFEPSAWGIRVYALDPDFQANWVDASPSLEDLPTLIRLAPMGDDVDKSVRFRTDSPTRVRIVSLGESADHKMVDYGWLVNEDRNRTVWEMSFDDTKPAGGAKKNRRADVTLTLDPGTYSLHYKSDGSHSFEDWNDKPPANAYYWGVTLLELSENR